MTGPLIKKDNFRDGNVGGAVFVEPSGDLMTDGGYGPSRRLRVDVAQTGFFAGREFRAFYEFSIPTGESVVLKFSSPVNFILFKQELTVDAGGIKYTAELQGTPGGSFTAIAPIGKNRMSVRPEPYYTAQATMGYGGTLSGGTVVDVARVVTSGATAQQVTVGATADERGLPAGDYYIRLANLSNGTSTGVYSIFWEERP